MDIEFSEVGKPLSDQIVLIGYTGGSSAAAQIAFETARRAIMQCGGSGYDLPAETDQFARRVRVAFDPYRMRLR